MLKPEALQDAQNYLSKQERTEAGLYQELIAKGHEIHDAKAVLEHAKAQAWVSDERYCLRFCERKLCKGYGPIVITEELRDKGLPTSAIVKSVADVEFSTWEHAAIMALEKKFGRDFKTAPRPQVISFLERRGFNDEYMLFLIKDD